MTSFFPLCRAARALPRALLLVAALQLAGCATPPSPPPGEATPLAQDTARLTDALLGQWRHESALRAAFARLLPRDLMLAPLAHPATGEQTRSLMDLRRLLAARVDAAFPEFQRSTAGSAPRDPEFLLHVGVAPEATMQAERRVVGADPQVTLSLVDLRTGRVVARAEGRVRGALADSAPSRFASESPAIVPPAVDLISPVPAGQPVPAQALQHLPAQGLIDLAQAAYDAGDPAQALALFTRAAQQPGGRQLRVYNGQYLAQMKLGRPAEAQQAFVGLVDLGLQNKALALKFLFRPDSTDFWPDPAVSGPYGGWLAEIAQQSAASGACLDVRGHSSRSGELAYNHRLSLQRAQRIRERLVEVQPPLASRLQTTGLGWTENIVGTGSDDASDAVDRRVEFRVAPCA